MGRCVCLHYWAHISRVVVIENIFFPGGLWMSFILFYAGETRLVDHAMESVLRRNSLGFGT